MQKTLSTTVTLTEIPTASNGARLVATSLLLCVQRNRTSDAGLPLRIGVLPQSLGRVAHCSPQRWQETVSLGPPALCTPRPWPSSRGWGELCLCPGTWADLCNSLHPPAPGTVMPGDFQSKVMQMPCASRLLPRATGSWKPATAFRGGQNEPGRRPGGEARVGCSWDPSPQPAPGVRGETPAEAAGTRASEPSQRRPPCVEHTHQPRWAPPQPPGRAIRDGSETAVSHRQALGRSVSPGPGAPAPQGLTIQEFGVCPKLRFYGKFYVNFVILESMQCYL